MAHARNEGRISKQREVEARQASLINMIKETQILTGHGAASDRVEKMRLQRIQRELENERTQEIQFLTHQQDVARKAALQDMEQRIADELERQNSVKIREEQIRRRVCDSSDELRAIKSKLLAAKTSRDRAAQLYELQTRSDEAQIADEKFETQLARNRFHQMEQEKLVEREKERARELAKQTQQAQIAEREAARRAALASHLHERSLVDAIVEKIRVEDQNELQTRRQKGEKTREQLLAFIEEDKRIQAAAAARDLAEQKSIEEFAAKKMQFEAALAAEKEAKEEAKRKILQKMLDSANHRNKQAEELEYFRNEVIREELEAQTQAREEVEQKKRMQDRLQMLSAYNEQMRAKEAKRLQDEAAEEEYRANLLAKFSEDDRIEQLNAQRRRMKLLEHKREADRLVEARRELFRQERQREVDELLRLQKMDEFKTDIVQEEKKRLLADFGADAMNFLPPGF